MASPGNVFSFKKLSSAPVLTKVCSIAVKLKDLGVVVTAATLTTVAVCGIQYLGGLERAEMAIYDWMVRHQKELAEDDRLLVVGITEEDIRIQKQWPLPDAVLAQALTELQQHNPLAIGIDIYRDLPQGEGYNKLVQQLEAPNIIGIRNVDTNRGVPAPPSIPPEQVGFNDLTVDTDGVVRRNLLFAQSPTGESLLSFSFLLALHYFDKSGTVPEIDETNEDRIFWGAVTLLPLKPTSGGYQNVDANGYQTLIDYRSQRRVAQKVSLTQLLDGRVDPEWVRNKIVLIGTTAPSGNDLFFTPYSAAEREQPKMPGVEVHAQMVSHLLDMVEGDRPLWRFWGVWMEYVWIGLWASVGSAIAFKTSHPVSVTVGNLGTIALLWAMGYGLFVQRQWVPLAAPTLAAFVAGGSVVAYQAYQASNQQKTVMKLLGQNVSPEVADALWDNRDRLLKSGKLPGQVATATMLFTDIKNFSTTSEQMENAEELFEWLNEYLGFMAEEVQQYHGIINKFTGDGMMAVFGLPVLRHSEMEIARDAQNAVACAVSIGDRLAQKNAEWQQKGWPVTQMRVGIYTGPVVAGSLGSSNRMEYGVIGDSVNIASRLESCEKQRQSTICRILIAEETYQYLRDTFHVEQWGPLALKGKHQVVHVYRIIDYKEGKRPAKESEKSEKSNSA